MNLGLTGPLNPLQPGNAALGAQPPRPRAAVRTEAAGSGVFCWGGPAGGQGWQGRAPRVRRARAPLRHPLPSGLPPTSLPRGPGARLCTFFPGPDGLARELQRGRRGLRGRARGPERPRRFPAQGLRLTRGRDRACAAGTGDLGAALAARSWGSPSPRRGRDPGPHAVPREARGDLGSVRIGGSWRKKLLSFEEVSHFLFVKPLFVRVRRAVAASAVEGNQGGPGTGAAASRPRLHGRLLFVSLIFRFLSPNLLDLTFLSTLTTASSICLVLKSKSAPPPK